MKGNAMTLHFKSPCKPYHSVKNNVGYWEIMTASQWGDKGRTVPYRSIIIFNVSTVACIWPVNDYCKSHPEVILILIMITLTI